MLRRNKRGRVPIVILVILVIVLFAFALLSYSLSTVKLIKKIGRGHSNVADFNVNVNNVKFTGVGDPTVEIKDSTGYLRWKKTFLSVRVERIP